MPIKYPEEVKMEAINKTTERNERLNSITEIIEFTGIPRRTFYGAGYAKNLKNSGYVFYRKGHFGKEIYWSYKRLILAWLAENFSIIPKNS